MSICQSFDPRDFYSPGFPDLPLCFPLTCFSLGKFLPRPPFPFCLLLLIDPSYPGFPNYHITESVSSFTLIYPSLAGVQRYHTHYGKTQILSPRTSHSHLLTYLSDPRSMSQIPHVNHYCDPPQFHGSSS